MELVTSRGHGMKPAFSVLACALPLSLSAPLPPGFPRDAKKEAIIEHFSRLYPLNDFDWKGRAPALGRLREPVRDTANSSDDRYVGKWVCEVTLARRNGRKLRTFLLNDEKTVALKRIRAHMKMYSEGTPLLDGKGASEDKYETFEKKLNELGAEMETIAERLGKDKSLAKVTTRST
jgi:hypothetical protein